MPENKSWSPARENNKFVTVCDGESRKLFTVCVKPQTCHSVTVCVCGGGAHACGRESIKLDLKIHSSSSLLLRDMSGDT